MKITGASIQWMENEFVLSSYRCLYWPAQEALLLADLHIGKATHFRKHGIAVPSAYIHNDLRRLSEAISHYKVNTIYILGDLIHADYNSELQLFNSWLTEHSQIECHVVLGNHDKKTQQWIKHLPLIVHEKSIIVQNCLLTHIPQTSGTHLVISGHIHPGIIRTTYIKKKIKLPCYLLQSQQIILPAFSKFTGLDTDYINNGKYKVFAVTEKEVIEIDV